MSIQSLFNMVTVGFALAVNSSALLCAAPITSDVTIGVSAADFSYKEFDNNRLLDREDGTLPGLKMDARLFSGPVFLGFQLDYARAEIDYEAPINTNVLRSNTDETVVNYRFYGGHQWSLADNIQLSTTLGFGERRWKRDIYSTPSASGLLEDYRWPYISLGAESTYRFNRQHSLSVSLEWYEVKDADIRVTFKNAQFDTIKFDLSDGDGYQASVRWQYRWKPTVTLSVSPTYRRWEIPRSNAFALQSSGMATNTLVTEPSSETEIVEVVFAIQKRW